MKSLHTILTFARIDILRSFRDKVALFFIFVFPLIFLFVFGGIFGKSSDVNFDIALINNANNSFTKQFVKEMKKEKFLKVNEDLTTIDEAKTVMKRGEIDAILVLPKDFGEAKPPEKPYPSGQAEIIYDQNNETSGQTLASIMDGVFKNVNQGITNAPTPFSVKTTSTKEKGLSSFDYIFSGLLGFTILSLGIFGPTSVFPRMKQNGILRRYHTTTLRVWEYFTANVLSQMFIGILAVTLMFIVALTIFKLNMRGDYFSLTAMVLIGTATIYGVGLAIGGWAKNENQAAPLANLVSFPMMFLSGTFFPKFMMPEWLQNISSFLPLTPINDGLRLIITEGKTLTSLGNELTIIGVWFVIIYIIAFKVFRWE
jgi:ABC-2 type transport system permease protein